MLTNTKKILSVLEVADKARFWILVMTGFLNAVIEVAGIASVIPFFALIGNPSILENDYDNEYISIALEVISESENPIFLVGVFSLFLFILSLTCKALNTYFIAKFTADIQYSVSERLFSLYLHQNYNWFLTKSSADVGKTIFAEVGAFIGNGFSPLVVVSSQISSVILILGLLVVVNPMLAVVTFSVIFVVYSLIYLSVSPVLGQLGKRRKAVLHKQYKYVFEAFGGIKEIKSTRLERLYCSLFRTPAREFSRIFSLQQLISSLPHLVIQAFGFGGMILVVVFMVNGGDDLGSVLPILSVYAFAAYRLLPAGQQLFSAFSSLRFAREQIEDIAHDFKSLQRDLDADACRNGMEHNFLVESQPDSSVISFEDSSYTYPGQSRPAVVNVSFKIKRGSKIGFAGPSGSGKTTIVDLILGLLSVDSGKVIVAPTFSEIGYVPQSIFLKDASIAENIAFGVDPGEIDSALVEEVATIAQLDEFVLGLPDKFETQVGERGVRISGGQRQRIGVARALYRQPKLLILDEATSALDGLTESGLLRSLQSRCGNLTIVMIAHRLMTLNNCDEILVFEDGSCVARGSYQELLEKCKLFAAMNKSYDGELEGSL